MPSLLQRIGQPAVEDDDRRPAHRSSLARTLDEGATSGC
jgi:hypothetical protein